MATTSPTEARPSVAVGTNVGSATHGTVRRVSARRPAQRVAHLRQLELEALRAYRQELITEESRVSYWRRILQARLDTANGTGTGKNPVAKLQSVLTQHQESSRRLACLDIHDAVSAPPLPDLAILWQTAADQGDDPALQARLSTAEAELSTYRSSLHARLDDATSELIARYREQPALAMRALPRRDGASVA